MIFGVHGRHNNIIVLRLISLIAKGIYSQGKKIYIYIW